MRIFVEMCVEGFGLLFPCKWVSFGGGGGGDGCLMLLLRLMWMCDGSNSLSLYNLHSLSCSTFMLHTCMLYINATADSMSLRRNRNCAFC